MTELMNEDNLGRKEEFVDQILENAMKQIHLIETKREGSKEEIVDQIWENALKQIRLMDIKREEMKSILRTELEALLTIGAEDPNTKEKIEQIEVGLECLDKAHDDAVEGITAKSIKLKSAVESMEDLNQQVADVEKNIEELKTDHKAACEDLAEKKTFLRERLESLENLDTIINSVEKQIKCCQLIFEDKLTVLEQKREGIKSSANLPPCELSRRLKEIQTQIDKLKKIHDNAIASLEQQRHILNTEYKIKYSRVEILKDQCELVASTDDSSSVSTESHLTSDEAHYLKIALGTPLSLGLAEIVARKPADPLHYLAHWLFKYRYNEAALETKKQELEDLIAERERIAREIKTRKLEIEAYAAVLEMIQKAETEAGKRALALRLLMMHENAEEDEGLGEG